MYPQQYMYDWYKFNEVSLPEEEDPYSNLSMKHITGAYYAHLKRVSKVFEIKSLSECHGLYV